MKKDRALLQTQPLQTHLTTFLGTENPRHLRVLFALQTRSRTRKQVDYIGGCSNGPELIAQLRRLGLQIPCVLIVVEDRDGKKCRAGVYHLTDSDRRKVNDWLKRREVAA